LAKSESRQAQFISDPYGFNQILHEFIESARNQLRDAKALRLAGLYTGRILKGENRLIYRSSSPRKSN
jgi:hypothetical protein